MTVRGVGPVVALTYRTAVDVPAGFRKFKSVGAVFGLTCSRDQSGERDRPGAISRCGDEMMRAMLYEVAQSMLARSLRWSWLKAWAMQIAKRRGAPLGEGRAIPDCGHYCTSRQSADPTPMAVSCATLQVLAAR
jgi:transposase